MLSAKTETTPQRLIASLPPGYLALMPGAVHQARTFGAKVVTLLPGNPERGRPAIQGVALLFDAEMGALVAIVDGAEVTLRRTAAASAAATRRLARPDAETLGVLGAGPQALAHIEAIARVRPLSEVMTWGRSPDRTETLAAAARELGHPTRTVRSAEEAAGAHIVCTVTGSSDPVIKGSWLRPGAHVNLVGAHSRTARELDTQGVMLAKVYVDCFDACMAEAGDLLIPIAEEAIGTDHIRGEVGQVIARQIPGRTTASEITLFKSVGHAVEDLVAAEAIYATKAAMVA